jgi:hypothetical protein
MAPKAKAPPTRKPDEPRDTERLPVVSFELDGKKIVVNVATLTIGERRRARAELKKLGDDVDELDGLAAMIWVHLRRDDPTLELEQLLDKLTIGDLATAEGEGHPAGDDPEG